MQSEPGLSVRGGVLGRVSLQAFPRLLQWKGEEVKAGGLQKAGEGVWAVEAELLGLETPARSQPGDPRWSLGPHLLAAQLACTLFCHV